jgi:hypothetical protein
MVQATIATPTWLPCVTRVVKVGLAFWLLLSPGDNWTWVIVGGHDSRQGCEEVRSARLDGDRLICVWTR